MSSAENFTQVLNVSNWSTLFTTSFENEVLCAYVRYHAMNHPPANICKVIQYNIIGSNTDGSFTVDELFFQSLQNSSNSSRKQIFRDFFLISSWNCMLCVLIRIASSRRF